MQGSGGLSHGVARSRRPGAASVAERYRRVAEPADARGRPVLHGQLLALPGGALRGDGAGWRLAGVLGLAAAITPGGSLAWYRVSVQAAVFLVVLGAGYGMEYVVAARTGRRSLGGGARHAEDR
jgi:hypothetical protein